MNTRHFSQLPKPYLALPKVIQGLIFKKPKGEKVLPQVEYVVDSFKADLKHLKTYSEICGYELNDDIPATYLAVVSQSLQMHMMSNEAFPFALLGLVHIRNQVKQLRKIALNETMTLSCQFGELKAHDKGLQFDFLTTAKIDGEVVMQGLTTYLSRQKTTASVAAKVKEQAIPNYQVKAVWDIAENTGRRYAMSSGDFNLIHIHALTAKAFGFKQAIAHGMWTKARALASLNLPDAYEADVYFKLPIFLPSTVEYLTAEADGTTQILVRNQKSHKPHMSGVVKTL